MNHWTIVNKKVEIQISRDPERGDHGSIKTLKWTFDSIRKWRAVKHMATMILLAITWEWWSSGF